MQALHDVLQVVGSHGFGGHGHHVFGFNKIDALRSKSGRHQAVDAEARTQVEDDARGSDHTRERGGIRIVSDAVERHRAVSRDG